MNSLLDLLRIAIPIALGPGGLVVVWMTLHHQKTNGPVAKKDVTEAELTHILSETGIAARWQNYSDDIEERLNRRLTEAEKRLSEAEKRNDRLSSLVDVHEAYERLLRTWIEDRKPPPPPAYPDAIDPACTGWDYGDHVTPHTNQEDS